MLTYTESTRLFMQDVRQICKTPESESDRIKYRNKNVPSSVKRLYAGDTSKFEPIPENRDHLINSMMPMIIKLARERAGKYGDKIELDDCISEGLRGAIIATDKYIAKSRISEQPAKLSTYAHSYIQKYINEYCWRTNSLLSHNFTKWSHASESRVLSGNSTYSDSEGKSTEFFDASGDKNLRSVQDTENLERIENAELLSNILFSNITKEDRKVLFLKFGIGTPDEKTKSNSEISKLTGVKRTEVNAIVESIITAIKANVPENVKPEEIVEVLRSVELSEIRSWNM